MPKRDLLVTPHSQRHAPRRSTSGGILTRRGFVRFLAAGSGLCLGCDFGVFGDSNGSARLSARPGTPSGTIAPGLVRLGNGDVHDPYVYVPASYQASTPMPLMLALHGAGRNVSDPLNLLTPFAESHGFLLLVANSSDYTWDGIIDHFGTDVRLINAALNRAFERCNVDPQRVTLQGFSDGASYGLGLGLANGDLFSRIIANSPGFIAESGSSRTGKPELFISHGVQDQVLPIHSTSRQIVPALQAEGYQVLYQEFNGGHGVPQTIAEAMVAWMLE